MMLYDDLFHRGQSRKISKKNNLLPRFPATDPKHKSRVSFWGVMWISGFPVGPARPGRQPWPPPPSAPSHSSMSLAWERAWLPHCWAARKSGPWSVGWDENKNGTEFHGGNGIRNGTGWNEIMVWWVEIDIGGLSENCGKLDVGNGHISGNLE